MKNLLRKIFPSKNDKDIKELHPLVAQINAAYEALAHISDDELRGKTAGFKALLKEKTEEIGVQLEELKAAAAEERDIENKNRIYDEIDALTKAHYELLEEVMEELLPEAFAVIKETARRLTEVGELRVKANDYDRELAELAQQQVQERKSQDKQSGKGVKRTPHIVIEGDTAIWKNSWLAADAEIEWQMIHYDVQLMGGAVLHQGKIAEMATGEGKTLVATLPVYLNAITGMGVHLVTVNNYLARRDAQWNAPLFQFHGLTVDCIDLHQPNSDERRKAYRADITYGTNNEFGFDYLRDNMTTHPEFLVQRRHFYSIIDEIDSVLIDEARTPLIISGPVPRGDKQEYNELKPRIERLEKKQKDLVRQLLIEAKEKINEGDEKDGGLALFRAFRGLPKYPQLIKYLSETGIRAVLQKTEAFYMQDNSKHMHIADDVLYFIIDEKNNQIEMTDQGRDLITRGGDDPDLFVLPDITAKFSEIEGDSTMSDKERLKLKDEISRDYAEKSERLHAIKQLLKAYTLFERDVEYIMQDDKVMIVDEQTGRVLAGRRYSDGLHQAIEAKENVKVEAATQTFATVTLQNYFRMYHKLSGMTGTAETEEAEFFEIYKLDVVVIPTNRPIARDDRDDLVYKTKREKYNAVIDEVNDLREAGQPVLVGTTSVEVSELLGKMLRMRKIPHNVLNAKQHQREAEVIVEAGQSGTITIATNMAGRGTDIKLGPGVKEAGGLAIIGTERHESRRIDRQLRGRAGRQGDPGKSQFYVSLEDDLMRLFGSERIAKIMDRMGLKEGEVIQHGMISKSISNAQKKVEENNFAMRKRLLEYDDVMNSQREVIYKRRRNALYGDRIKIDLENMLYDFCGALVARHIDMTDAENLRMDSFRYLAIDPEISEKQLNDQDEDALTNHLFEVARSAYERKSEALALTLYEGISAIKKRNPAISRIEIIFSDGGSKRLRIYVLVDEVIESKGQTIVDELEKATTLSVIDNKWKNHLREMDELRTSVQNAVFEQKDPLLVYKFESFELFQQALNDINQQVLSFLFKVKLEGEEENAATVRRDDFSLLKTRHEEADNARRRQMEAERKVMAAAGGDDLDQKVTRTQKRKMEDTKTRKKKWSRKERSK